MVRGLQARAEALAQRRRAIVVEKLLAAIPPLPGIGAEKSAGGIVLKGRRLKWRLIVDPGLRALLP